MIGMGKPSMAESLGYGRDSDRDGEGTYVAMREDWQKEKNVEYVREQDHLVVDLYKRRYMKNSVTAINDFCS